ncbi:MAG: hypothetical protein KF778_18745 [Rhodocyclaceae bacterium]|nr:hypothetical protein [Rhodocyclaceae bacterium]
MRAPHPALQRLYAAAAASMALGQSNARAAESLTRITDPAGPDLLNGDALLAPLLRGFGAGEALAATLARSTTSAAEAPRPPPPQAPHRRIASAPAVAGAGAAAFDPLAHPRLARLRAARAGAMQSNIEEGQTGAAAGHASAAAPGPAALRTSPLAEAVPPAAARYAAADGNKWLEARAERAGVAWAAHSRIAVARLPAAGSAPATAGSTADAPAAPPQTAQAPSAKQADGSAAPASYDAPLAALLARLEARPPGAQRGLPAQGRRNTNTAPDPGPQSPRRPPAAASDATPGAAAPEQPAVPAARPAAIPPLASAAPRRTDAALNIGGFRGLAELGRRTPSAPSGDAAATAGAQAPARLPLAPPPALPPALQAEALAELLRREARRHGIDLAGLEP